MLELREAAEWYENERGGLGAELIEEFEQTLDEALEHLEIGAVVAMTSGGEAIRRFRLGRFSRYAIYLVRSDDIPTVIAFEHASRRPAYWLQRLQ
jgi:toxin ParE1/3/4